MIETIMKKFRETAADPLKMKEKYLAEGRKIVLMAATVGVELDRLIARRMLKEDRT